MDSAISITNSVYSALQSGALHLQRSGNSRFKWIGSGLPIFDGIMLAFNATILWSRVEDKARGYFRAGTNPRYKLLFYRIKMGAAALGIFALNAFLVRKINQFYRPSINLQELFKNGVSLQGKNLPTIDVNWNVPGYIAFQQWIYLNRIFIHLVSGFLFSKPKLELVNAAQQAANLWFLLNIQRNPRFYRK